MAERFPDANVAVLTGLSDVTVVDIDDDALVPDMIRRFGETPLMTATPSGGTHLWYRGQGERCANLRPREGLAVDIKGAGGIIVVPPSYRPKGAHAGRSYDFRQGSWEDISCLPTLRHASLPIASGNTKIEAGQILSRPMTTEGERNATLYRKLLRQAPACDSLDDLVDTAHGVNMSFIPPLSDNEVVKTARSAWRCEQSGQNFVGRQQRIYHEVVHLETLAKVTHGADALLLFSILLARHWDRPSFAAPPEAMARSGVIASWGHSHNRYRRALASLVEAGLLTIVHEGGRGLGDPRLFKFTRAL